MEDPVRELPEIVQTLTTSPPGALHSAVSTYFLPTARFSHPLCHVPSFSAGSSKRNPGPTDSRDVVLAIYRWYKILSPWIAMRVEGVAWREWDDDDDETKRGRAYIDAVQEMRYWFVPYVAKVRLCSVIDCALLPAGSNRPDFRGGDAGKKKRDGQRSPGSDSGSSDDNDGGDNDGNTNTEPSYAAVANPRVPTHVSSPPATHYTGPSPSSSSYFQDIQNDKNNNENNNNNNKNVGDTSSRQQLWYVTAQTDYYQPDHFLDFLPVIGHLLRPAVLAMKIIATIFATLGSASFIALGWCVLQLITWFRIVTNILGIEIAAVKEYAEDEEWKGTDADHALELVLRIVGRVGFGGRDTRRRRGRGEFGGVLKDEEKEARKRKAAAGKRKKGRGRKKMAQIGVGEKAVGMMRGLVERVVSGGAEKKEVPSEKEKGFEAPEISSVETSGVLVGEVE